MPIALIAVVVVAVLAAAGFFIFTDTTEEMARTETDTPAIQRTTSSDENESEEAVTSDTFTITTDEADPSAENTETESVSRFVDGTYTAAASYFTPRNDEHDVEVELTIANDVVVDATVLYDGAQARTPQHTRFDDAYASEVVGVSLADISLSRVGGASLTTGAFNEALAEIKTEAEA